MATGYRETVVTMAGDPFPSSANDHGASDPYQQRRARASRPAHSLDVAPSPWPVPRHIADTLSLGGVLRALDDAMSADALRKREQAASSQPFRSDEAFRMALQVFNKRGEQIWEGRHVQDWFFAQAYYTSSSTARSTRCSRCQGIFARGVPYWCDRAKPRHQAEQLCRPCMVYVLRVCLGDDEDGVSAMWAQLADWLPVVDASLAQRLIVDRTFFADR